MAQKEQIIEIDEQTYKVLMLDPFTATDMLADIAAVLGPSLAALSGLVKSKEDLAAAASALAGEGDEEPAGTATAVERAVGQFFERFSKAQQRDIMTKLAKVTFVVNGEKELLLEKVFTEHFRGRTLSLYKWLGMALKVQFDDFFTGSGGAIKAVVQKLVRGL